MIIITAECFNILYLLIILIVGRAVLIELVTFEINSYLSNKHAVLEIGFHEPLV